MLSGQDTVLSLQIKINPGFPIRSGMTRLRRVRCAVQGLRRVEVLPYASIGCAIQSHSVLSTHYLVLLLPSRFPFLQAVSDILFGYPQNPRGLALVTVGILKSLKHDLLFNFIQSCRKRIVRFRDRRLPFLL